MFELYTEKARRVIFYARYEASTFGSPYIDTEHLTLALLRESDLMKTMISAEAKEKLRSRIIAENGVRQEISTSVDLPLSHDARRVLAYAMEEAERLAHKQIEPEHLALGLLRTENTLGAQLLLGQGVTLEQVRRHLIKPPETPASGARIVHELQGRFASQIARLTPEAEPATIFRVK